MRALTADTIAALSSASGSSRTAIIRVSGPEAIDLVGSFCPGVEMGAAPGFHAVPALLDLPGAGRVQCEIYIFRTPASYTTEDVAEIHLPGSPLLVEKVLLALAGKGARPAAPGEFTRRAFLGGRIDLAQAEAVSSVINARSTAQLAAAARMLKGSFSKKLAPACEQLKHLLSLVEASIDFGDQDIELVSEGEIHSQLRQVSKLLNSLGTPQREARRDLLRVLICGAANVGKSSLFNRLLANERALTSSTPGTTRDVVSATLDLQGTQVLLLDSAGRKEVHGEVEALARSALDDSLKCVDIALLVIESYKTPTQVELDFFESLMCAKLLIANKCDLGLSDNLPECIKVSCLTGVGIAPLKKALVRAAMRKVGWHGAALALSVRQRDALKRARAALERAQASRGDELLAEDLRFGLNALGEITGETLTEEILERIFEQFCIGK